MIAHAIGASIGYLGADAVAGRATLAAFHVAQDQEQFAPPVRLSAAHGGIHPAPRFISGARTATACASRRQRRSALAANGSEKDRVSSSINCALFNRD